MSDAPRSFLALDLNTKTGWAAGFVGQPKPRSWGVWDLAGPWPVAGKGAALADFLSDAITFWKPGLVIFEAPLIAGKQSSHQTAYTTMGLAFMAEVVCFRRNIRVLQANVQTVRSRVLGQGRGMSKQEIIAWVRRRDIDVTDDNAADAIVLWLYAVQERLLKDVARS